jgi:hypothetical protein
MPETFFLLLILVCLVAGYAVWEWSKTQSSAMLHTWADENGFTIVSQKFCHFWRGPFFFTTSKGQVVYRITLRDKAGSEWTGWARCGGWFWGLMSNQVTVRLDEAPVKADSSMRDRWLDT